jgi:hypothetical protein
MSDPVTATPATGTVHWIGTGLSTGSGLRVLTEAAARTVVWGRTAGKAEACLDRLGLGGAAEPRALDAEALAGVLRPGDVVVSMLPATEHPALVRLCVRAGAHFACSSYVSPDLLDAASGVGGRGLVVLTEAGLDPGIDHLLAHRLVGEARAALGDGPAAIAFTSYCGGVPAEPNAFRYRFSWAPRGVLHALCEPARYLEAGAEQTISEPWERVRGLEVGGEVFEAFPNRDSLPFVEQYGLPGAWRPETFVRGTLRLQGWRQAWEPVFAELRGGDQARVDALADELAARHPMTDADHDRVILAVALEVVGDGTGHWGGAYHLDVVGDATERAMARCVSLPLARGVADILADRLAPGLHRAVQREEDVDRWLSFLRDHGVDCRAVHPVSAAAPREHLART